MNKREKNKTRKVPTAAGKEEASGFTLTHLYWLLACFLITFLCYIPSLTNGWTHWDDHLYVLENELTRNLSFHTLGEFFTTFHVGNYHPFAMLSLALDFKLFGQNPSGFHAHSVVLHVWNVSLLFVFVWLLTKRLWPCVIAALFFGIHPAHVESVSWISERKDVLYVFYYFAALTAYLIYRNTEKKTLWYAVTLLLFVCSLLSKGQAVTFPVALLLVDYFMQRKLDKKAWMEKIPFFLLALLFGIIAIYAQQSIKAIMDIEHYSFSSRLLFACYALVSYAGKALFPLHLSAYYPYPATAPDHYGWLLYASPVVALVISVVFFSLRKNKAVVFGFGFFLLNVALILQILPVGGTMMADRYTYLAYAGLFVLMGIAADRVFSKSVSTRSAYRIPAVAAMLGLTVFFCIKTNARQGIWKKDLTLFSDMLANAPDAAVVNNNMGNALQQEGETEAAIRHFTRVISLQPDYGDAYTNRGGSYLKLGKAREAISDLDLAIKYHPQDVKNYTLRAEAWKQQGDLSAALQDLLYALSVDATNKYRTSDIYSNMGDIYSDQHRYASADSCYALSLSFNPDNLATLNNYAYQLAMRNERPQEALAMIQKAVELDAKDGNSMDTYGWILYKQGKYGDAQAWIRKALDNGMENNGEVLEHYGDVLYQLKDTAGAMQYWQQARSKGVQSEVLLQKIMTKKVE